MKKILIVFVFLSEFMISFASGTDHIDWATFLQRHDPIWELLPQEFDKGAFIGNGLIGTTVYQEDCNTLRLAMGRSDVTDHRYDNGRILMGGFLLRTKGTIRQGSLRTSLWNAEILGDIHTDKGTISFTAYVHANRPVLIVDIKTEGSEVAAFTWDGAQAIVRWDTAHFTNLPYNPPPNKGKEDGIEYSEQIRNAGGTYTVAWQHQNLSMSNSSFMATVADSYPSNDSKAVALETIRSVNKILSETRIEEHRQWWHTFYPASFLSVPDGQIEGFYWIQMYKYGSAIREDGIVLDLQGPWNRKTNWPRVWWNLNIQVAYYPVFTANHAELSKSFTNFIDTKRANFVRNAKDIWGVDNCATTPHTTCYEGLRGNGDKAPDRYINPGDFTWALHLYWMQYRYTMNERLITDSTAHAFFSLLKQSVNLYRHLLKKGEDGKLHLPVLHSPEYNKEGDSNNNYNLSILRWACHTLLYLNERYALNDPLALEWEWILNNLVAYPTDENGFKIGATVSFEKSHRHWSHLLMVWPFGLLTPDQPENREIVERSLLHWLTVENGKQIYGWSNAAASLLYSTMKDGNNAYKQLKAHHNNIRFVMPNTMYIEGSPVIECSLFAARALQEMLLQSSDGISVFPSMPDCWKDASFSDLRAEGAFTVSAIRKGGQTRKIEITSLAGEPCIVHLGSNENLQCTLPASKVKRLNDRTVQLLLEKGETAVLYKRSSDRDLKVGSCNIAKSEMNYWGVKGGK